MTPRYATGRMAWGMCARSGNKMLLRDMVEDPRTGLMVDPGWAEPPDPRPPTDITDGVALERPAPDLDSIGTLAYPGTIDVRPLSLMYEMGNAKGTAT